VQTARQTNTDICAPIDLSICRNIACADWFVPQDQRKWHHYWHQHQQDQRQPLLAFCDRGAPEAGHHMQLHQHIGEAAAESTSTVQSRVPISAWDYFTGVNALVLTGRMHCRACARPEAEQPQPLQRMNF